MAKPVVFATRKLPAAVEARLARDYEAILNPDDRLYGADELVEIAARADALLPCHTEKLTAEVIGRLPARVKAIANFSRSEEHTSELQSLMRISYAVFCLKKKKKDNNDSTRA